MTAKNNYVVIPGRLIIISPKYFLPSRISDHQCKKIPKSTRPIFIPRQHCGRTRCCNVTYRSRFKRPCALQNLGVDPSSRKRAMASLLQHRGSSLGVVAPHQRRFYDPTTFASQFRFCPKPRSAQPRSTNRQHLLHLRHFIPHPTNTLPSSPSHHTPHTQTAPLMFRGTSNKSYVLSLPDLSTTCKPFLDLFLTSSVPPLSPRSSLSAENRRPPTA